MTKPIRCIDCGHEAYRHADTAEAPCKVGDCVCEGLHLDVGDCGPECGPHVEPLWRRCLECFAFIRPLKLHDGLLWLPQRKSDKIICPDSDDGRHVPGILMFDYPGQRLPTRADLEDEDGD